MTEQESADCGVTFEHDPHGFLDASGRVRACDGSASKRPRGDR